jgi:hypothetical protein
MFMKHWLNAGGTARHDHDHSNKNCLMCYPLFKLRGVPDVATTNADERKKIDDFKLAVQEDYRQAFMSPYIDESNVLHVFENHLLPDNFAPTAFCGKCNLKLRGWNIRAKRDGVDDQRDVWGRVQQLTAYLKKVERTGNVKLGPDGEVQCGELLKAKANLEVAEKSGKPADIITAREGLSRVLREYYELILRRNWLLPLASDDGEQLPIPEGLIEEKGHFYPGKLSRWDVKAIVTHLEKKSGGQAARPGLPKAGLRPPARPAPAKVGQPTGNIFAELLKRRGQTDDD